LSKGGTFGVACSTTDEACSDMKRALSRNGFRLIEESRVGDQILIRAVYGSRFFFLLHKFLPFASIMKIFQRCGCEARFWKSDDGILAEVYVIPYMEVLDREEIFILTQNWLERRVDERLSNEMWDKIFDDLRLDWQSTRHYDRVPESIPTAKGAARRYSDSCPPRYNARYCPYCEYCAAREGGRYCTKHGVFL